MKLIRILEDLHGRRFPIFKEEYDFFLNEENSGITDHKAHSIILEKIMDGIYNILFRIKDDKVPLKNSKDREEFNYTEKIIFSVGCNYEEEDISDRLLKYEVECLVTPSNEKKSPIISAGVILPEKDDKFLTVWVKVNENITTSQIKKEKQSIRDFLSHEVSHVIKHLYGQYQKSKEKFNGLTSDEDYVNYLKYKHEFESNIARANSELENINKKYPDISYDDALHLSRIYREYSKHIFKKEEKLKKTFLKKTNYYWRKIKNGKK